MQVASSRCALPSRALAAAAPRARASAFAGAGLGRPVQILRRRGAAFCAFRPTAAAAASFGGEGAWSGGAARASASRGRQSAPHACCSDEAACSCHGARRRRRGEHLSALQGARPVPPAGRHSRGASLPRRTQRAKAHPATRRAGSLTPPRGAALTRPQATYEEIQDARNFLAEQHKARSSGCRLAAHGLRERCAAAGAAWLTRVARAAQSHVPGREAIDLAFDKIIDQARLSAPVAATLARALSQTPSRMRFTLC